MIPTRRLLWALAALAASGVAASLWPQWATAWWTALGLAAALAALDAAWAAFERAPETRRSLPPALPMGVDTRVEIELRNPGRRALAIRVYDHLPPRAHSEELPLECALPAGRRAELEYRLRPEERGLHAFGPLELWLRSPLGLWERRRRSESGLEVRAYPNFRAAAGYELLAAADRTGSLGIRRRPRRGEGLEFHQLRDYREGDALRQIDWKATSRLQRTISREYQEERDQQVLFLLDCGRRLHSRDGERSHFDAALDALLLLSHVALRQGDAVGLLTFSGPRRWLAPRKGLGHAGTLLHAVHDLRTSPLAGDFAAGARDLVQRARKRALVILLSNLRDEDADELGASLRLLSRHHLVLLVSLREPALAEALASPVRDLHSALRHASVRQYLEQRREALAPLSRDGALLLESEPDGLSVALVNRYLDIKAAGVL